MIRTLLPWVLLWVLVVGFSPACGDDARVEGDGATQGDGDGDGDADGHGDGHGDGDGDIGPVVASIAANVGGHIEVGGVALKIPAGALEEDTEIAVEVILAADVPNEDSLASLIYELGPNGLEFSEPVTLTFDLNADVPSGMTAQIAWLDEDAERWVALEDSALDGDTVTASTTHFSLFAIVLTQR